MPNTIKRRAEHDITLESYFGSRTVAVNSCLFLPVPLGFRETAEDPLCASIEEDPCYADGVFEIYNAKDYLRFAGYMNRASKEEEDYEAGY